jgi:hypothetical protein
MDELKEGFEEMGARVRVSGLTPRVVDMFQRRRWDAVGGHWRVDEGTPIRLDIQRDMHGEYFDLHRRRDVTVEVLDVDADDRHLVLRSRDRSGTEGTFLCGHDERSWFVAAVPERARAETVQEAKDALKPAEVWEAMRAYGVPPEQRDQRRTAAFVRQGEWFFIPRPSLEVKARDILRNEPIQRGGGKPHVCQFLYRYSGELVWVHDEDYPNGLTQSQFDKLSRPTKLLHGWRQMMRGATVFVRGAIGHPDHDTIHLRSWHQVVMNTETEALSMAHMAFFD